MVLIFELSFVGGCRGEADYHANLEAARFSDDADWLGLLVDDGLNAAGFEECDDAGCAVPDAVASAPDFVGVDLAAARQNDHGLAAASRADAWSTGGNGIDAGGRVCCGDACW